jgi:hypothetical protein
MRGQEIVLMRRYPIASKKEEVSNYRQPGSQLLMDPKTAPNLRVAQKLEPHDGKHGLRWSSESLLEKKNIILKYSPFYKTRSAFEKGNLEILFLKKLYLLSSSLFFFLACINLFLSFINDLSYRGALNDDKLAE